MADKVTYESIKVTPKEFFDWLKTEDQKHIQVIGDIYCQKNLCVFVNPQDFQSLYKWQAGTLGAEDER